MRIVHLARSAAICALLCAALAQGGAAAGVLDHTVTDIDGNEVDLSRYKAKVLLIVNVASKDGLTIQYRELVRLHRTYARRGFRVLAFPSNDFNGQEPGTNAEIKEFCKTKYHVRFPLFAKISVRGPDQSPLYRDLTSSESGAQFSGDILWNFTKFLVDRDGKVIARYEPRVIPDSYYVTSKIEEALGPEEEADPEAEPEG